MYERTMMATGAKTREKAVRLFHALSDEMRVRILDRLRDGEQCVCDLTEAFNTGQSRLSFHLRVLKDAGLVIDRPEGRWIYYSISQDAIQELEDLIAWLKESQQASHRAPRCL
jgi:ArsR family transcriptional regulator